MPIANALRSSMFLRNSRGALTPSNLHWTFSVRLNRFTAEYKEEPHSMRDKKRNQGGIRCCDNKQSKTTVKLRKLRETTGKILFYLRM